MRNSRALLILLPLLVGGAAAKGGKPAAIPAPVVTLQPAEIEATPEFQWQFEVHVANIADRGVYCDSVIGRFEDQDPGDTRTPRTMDFPLAAARLAFAELSAGDENSSLQTIPALFETGTMRLRLWFHRSDGTKDLVETPVVKLLPGQLSKDHPSQFLTIGGKKVETVTFPARPQGPAAALLLVPDHGTHARRLMPFGNILSVRGYTTMIVSLPGYGQSEGPADFAGPRSIAALDAAIDQLKRTAGVDSQRVAVWGIGRGATAAMSLAAHRSDLELVIGQSGLYDLRAAGGDTRAAIAAEAGKDTAAWRARSPLFAAAGIHAPVVLLHGGADREAPLDQAQAFATALTAAGDSVTTSWFAPQGHDIPRALMMRNAVPQLDTKLHRP